MRLTIDTDLCSGHGLCYGVAPALITDDERGYGQVLGDGEVPPELSEQAHLACARCPEGAITILSEPGSHPFDTDVGLQKNERDGDI